MLAPFIVVAVIAAACGSSVDASGIDPLPEIAADELAGLLEAGDRPTVLNVWASWCIPCRSEAPLLREAHRVFGDRVRFIGLDVRDNQESARAFLAEFELDGFDHYFDPSGAAQGSLGAGGVPLTFFYAAGGELVELHFGVIDERALALNIDEIIRQGT